MFGLFHGLVLLPVLLTLGGREARSPVENKNSENEDETVTGHGNEAFD